MNDSLNVLLIEDSVYDAELLLYELKRSGFDVHSRRIQSRSELLNNLNGQEWDIILSDHNLPGFSALEALQIYKESSLDIPFIIVSGQIGEEVAADCMRSGCHDYVIKNNMSRLGPAVKREVHEARLRRERRRIENELLREKELFTVTLRSIGEGVIVTDLDARVLFINKSAEDLCGWTNSEANGRYLWEVFCLENPESDLTALSLFNEVLSETKIAGLQRGTVLRDKSGQKSSVSASFAPIEDGQKELVGVVVVFRDISRFIQAEESLARSRDYYLSLFEEFPAMIWQSGVDGRCNYFNKAWHDYTGRKPADSMLYIWNEAVHPDYLEGVKMEFLDAFHDRLPFEVEYLMKRKDGTYRWIRNIARPFIDLNDQFSGYIGSCYDITEIKNVLTEMKRAKEAAEAANSMKNQFLANVSHEIRTPLNGIMGMTELTLATELTGEQRDNLLMIRESSESLLMIIGDILDFARMEAGKIVLENLDFNLLELMEKTVKRFHAASSQKRLNLLVDIDADVPVYVKGDSHRLQQVMVNLIGNALKFTEAGEIRVEVKRNPAEGREVRLRFSVSDTGIGINEEDKDKLFKSFSQVDGSYTRKYGGIGLGLAISRQLVEMMGGTIGVESQKGQGSCFHFLASFAPSDIKEQDETANRRSFGSFFAPTRILRILIVEDNRISRQIAGRMLRRWGHCVLEAVNGQQALDVLEDNEVDLVLMDVQMPVLDGIKATQAIRRAEAEGSGHLPVIALTAHAIKGDQERFIDAGMDGYLSKPFSESDLFAVIEQFSETESGVVREKTSNSAESLKAPRTRQVSDSVFQWVDREELLERVNCDIDFAREMLGIFFEETRERLADMVRAAAESDYRGIEKSAHTMKGAAAYLSLKDIKTLAFKIEIACRKEDQARMTELMQELGVMLSRIDGETTGNG